MYRKLNTMMPEVKVPSVPVLWLKKRNPFAKAFSRAYVQQVWRRWYLYIWNPLKWLEVWIFEWFHGARFLVQFLRAGK